MSRPERDGCVHNSGRFDEKPVIRPRDGLILRLVLSYEPGGRMTRGSRQARPAGRVGQRKGVSTGSTSGAGSTSGRVDLRGGRMTRGSRQARPAEPGERRGVSTGSTSGTGSPSGRGSRRARPAERGRPAEGGLDGLDQRNGLDQRKGVSTGSTSGTGSTGGTGPPSGTGQAPFGIFTMRASGSATIFAATILPYPSPSSSNSSGRSRRTTKLLPLRYRRVRTFLLYPMSLRPT